MSKQTQGLAAVMPSTEELKTAGIRELSAEELLEVNGGRQVEGAINPYGPDPDIPDDPPSSSGSSSDYSSGSSSGSSGSSETSSGSSIDSSSNTSENTSSSSSSDTSDDNSSDSTSSSGSSSNASEDTSSSGSGSNTSNDSSSDSNSSSGSSSNASEDTSSSSSSDTSNDSSSDSYEDEECGNYDNSSSDTGSNASENTSSNNSYSPDYEDEEPGSYDNSCNNPDAGSSDSSSSSSSYPDKDNNDSYAKNHSESSSGNSAEQRFSRASKDSTVETPNVPTRQEKKSLSDTHNKVNELLKDKKKDLPDLEFHLLRHPDSYTTFDGKNRENRGKDLLILENKTINQSIITPVSSVANMPGFGSKDTLAEGNFTLTFDPNVESKYAPNVLTITSGSLMPTIPFAYGETLSDKGITKSNSKPWRAHDTQYWGSEGCITGQKNNIEGDISTLIQGLKKYGITDKIDIPGSFGLGL